MLQMLGGGTEKQERQPVALRVHSRVTHLLAHSFQPAKVVVLAEQSLALTTLLRVGQQDNPNLPQVNLSSRSGLAGRQFLWFHAVEPKKFKGKCPAKSALDLFLLLHRVFMHTRWSDGTSPIWLGLTTRKLGSRDTYTSRACFVAATRLPRSLKSCAHHGRHGARTII